MRHALAVIWLLILAAAAAAQDGAPPVSDEVEGQRTFFDVILVLLVVLPVVLMTYLAVRRAKSSPSTLPVWDDTTFEEEVLGARQPVLVHFAEEWNITNRAAKSQTEVLAYMNRGAMKVGYLEIHDAPGVMERFPDFVPPAYLLFFQGRKLFHRPGLWQADDLQEHIDRALAREGF